MWIGPRVGCRDGARSSCVFGTEPVLGTRVWRGARFWSRVARAREEFEFGLRNARDIMRRTQRIIKPPSYPGYNSDSQLSVSNTSGFEVEDLLISQDNNDCVNVTPTSNGHTGLTQAMQDLQIEDVIPETDPNLESHDEDIMKHSVRHLTNQLVLISRIGLKDG